MEEQNPMRVGELSRHLKIHIEENFKSVFVQGEISGFKKHTSGHSYFALKDQEAVLDAICWRGTKLNVELTEGLEVIVRGRITTYMGRSKYQMIVEEAKSAGEGALLKLLMERKERLQKEGLFAQKRPLPVFPQTIGIITSETGAVIQDILHRLEERYPCHVVLCPVLVQGQGASGQIAKAIDLFNQLPQKVDVLIIARGGGSVEDLWAFNEEEVLRAAFNSQIPTISAVGHETDWTLLDFVADVRAPTPTAAAELATPVLKQVIENIQYKANRVFACVTSLLENYVLRLRAMSYRRPENYLEDIQVRFDDWVERLCNSPSLLWKNYAQRLSIRLPHPREKLEKSYDDFKKLNDLFSKSFDIFMKSKEEMLERYGLYLKHGSPERVLERGFCWIEAADEMITEKEKLEKHLPGVLTLSFKDGKTKIQASKA